MLRSFVALVAIAALVACLKSAEPVEPADRTGTANDPRVAEPAIAVADAMVVTAVADAPEPDAAVVTGPVLARVVKTQILANSETVVTVNRGSDAGIQKHWLACLPLPNDKCRPQSELVIVRVNPHDTVLRTKLTPQALQADPIVKLFAP